MFISPANPNGMKKNNTQKRICKPILMYLEDKNVFIGDLKLREFMKNKKLPHAEFEKLLMRTKLLLGVGQTSLV